MRDLPVPARRILPGAVALAVLLPGAAAAVDAGSLQELLYSNILVNLAFAAAIVFLGIFGIS